MKKCILLIQSFICFSAVLFAQSVGINSTGTAPNPAALLHVDLGTSTTKGLLVTGTYNLTSTVPDLGAGSRLLFYPGKAAFRAGHANGAQWNNVYVGLFSTAMGYSTTASGYASTAIGSITTASGFYSTATGIETTASGDFSTAMGVRVNTNNQSGAFIIGDSDPNNEGAILSGFPDEFVARFWRGYYFLTSGNMNRFGVSIGHNGNAWTTICDKNRKENFEQLDGEDVLQKISNINFTSWNYKQQDAKIYRHYGIMAQDFYNAFGHDKYGSIGNDTTVNPIDMIGIDMAAIQALEKRTALLNEELKVQKAWQAETLEKSENQIAELTRQNKDLAKRLQQLEALVLGQNKENTISKN